MQSGVDTVGMSLNLSFAITLLPACVDAVVLMVATII